MCFLSDNGFHLMVYISITATENVRIGKICWCLFECLLIHLISKYVKFEKQMLISVNSKQKKTTLFHRGHS